MATVRITQPAGVEASRSLDVLPESDALEVRERSIGGQGEGGRCSRIQRRKALLGPFSPVLDTSVATRRARLAGHALAVCLRRPPIPGATRRVRKSPAESGALLFVRFL
jgi:hypothetical protein